jgi:hypothetical protein
LELALVAETGGTRPLISLVDVRRLVVDHYSIPGDNFQVKWYFPEDIIIVFSYLNEMLQVLHDPPVGDLALRFVFKRWRGSFMPVRRTCAITSPFICSICWCTSATSSPPLRFLVLIAPTWWLHPP